MKLDDLLKKEGMTPFTRKPLTESKEEAPDHKRERPWLQAEQITDPKNGQNPEADYKIESNPPQNSRTQKVNGEQTGNKLATNRQQTDNKPATNLTTNQQQTGNKPATNNEQNDQTGNKVGTQPATLSATNWQQTGNKPATNSPFSALVGLQRAVMIFLYGSCKTARSRSTEALTLEHLGYCLKTSAGSVKTTIQRLEHKSYVLRVSFKNGRGGWSIYELPDHVFREMLQLETENKLATNREQTGNKVGTQPATEPATSPLSSSINELNTNTKGDKNGKSQLPDEWGSLDWTEFVLSLGEIDLREIVGLYRKQLDEKQNYIGLSLEEIQTNIDRVVHDMRSGAYKGRENQPRGIFFGAISNRAPYNLISKGFESRKVKEAKRQEKEAEAELVTIKASQDRQYALVEEQWLQAQDLSLLKGSNPAYQLAKTTESLIAVIRQDFKRQNYSKIIYEKERDIARLSLLLG